MNTQPNKPQTKSTVTRKLWLVEFRTVAYTINPCYVVAPDATTAYQAARDDMDKTDCGFAKDRTLKTITLLAEDAPYPSTERRLYIWEPAPEQPSAPGIEAPVDLTVPHAFPMLSVPLDYQPK